MKKIFITPGEPAGIGPDILIDICERNWPAELIAIADPKLLQSRAKLSKRDIKILTYNPHQPATFHQPGVIKVHPIALHHEAEPGELHVENAPYVLKTLETAAKIVMQQKNAAIVTGPVHKGIINQAGISFTGHTEFFAAQANVAKTVMLFVVDKLKVALATTHLPLKDVSQAITKESLIKTISILHDELINKFKIPNPKIYVCGLNPHAGENGYLGREEIEVITPTLQECKEKGINVLGPFPADTVFTQKYLKEADVILAMYHDQALPLVKYLGFGHAVNVTLGLPFIRTSVDHGTALDVAGTHQVDPGSMVAAIQLAIDMLE